MPFYQTEEQLYDVLASVFERVRQKPEYIETFTSSNLVIRMRFLAPTAEVLLDGRQPPLEVFYGDRPGRADLELTMQADDLHKIWLGNKRLREAFFSGEIKTKGNIMRATKLTDLFREAERAYPYVLAEKGLQSGKLL
jgi:alkyl sulfatase BDS1-like metallo-beta-lactamase superfamily hydrolase